MTIQDRIPSGSRSAGAQTGAQSGAPASAARKPQRYSSGLLTPTLIALGIALIVAVIGVAIGMHFLSEPASSTKTDTTQSGGVEAYESPYDFANLSFDDSGRPRYVVNGALKSQIGIDVSDHQGEIDWQAVAGDNIAFAYVRIAYRGTTEGGLFTDESYDKNVTNAQAARLDVGVYFYSQATSTDEAREEAEYVIGLLNGRSLELPVVFDYEADTTGTRIHNVSNATATEVAETFCSALEAAGYDTMVYGNQYDLARMNLLTVTHSASVGAYALGVRDVRPVWLAEYDASEPSAQFDFAMWQYSNSGAVAGVSTSVDMNIRFTDYL